MVSHYDIVPRGYVMVGWIGLSTILANWSTWLTLGQLGRVPMLCKLANILNPTTEQFSVLLSAILGPNLVPMVGDPSCVYVGTLFSSVIRGVSWDQTNRRSEFWT